MKKEPESRENRFAENMKEEARLWERSRERQRQRLQGHGPEQTEFLGMPSPSIASAHPHSPSLEIQGLTEQEVLENELYHRTNLV